jgi:hypothetical protein
VRVRSLISPLIVDGSSFISRSTFE